MRQIALDIAPAPAPTLANFVAGRNAELLAALRALVSSAAGERSYYLWGDAGSGRNHLVRAVVAAARAHGRTALLCADAGMLREAPDDALVGVDDVHLLAPAAQIDLFDLYNRLRAGGGALVAAGNAAPAQLALRADLATRLASGLTYRVHVLSDEEKKTALLNHAGERGLPLAPAIADFLLAHARRDLPSLLGLLDALDRHALETRRAITIPLLRELLDAEASNQNRPE